MARIVSIGSARQEIYLIDHDDFVGSNIAGHSMFSQLVVGREALIDRITFEVGGSGANAAVAFARSGHESIYIGNLTHDPAGEAVLERLDREGVDTSFLNFSKTGDTSCSVILLDTKSRRSTVLAHRGVSSTGHQLTATDLDAIQPDWLYAGSLGGDMEVLRDFFEQAHALGARVAFHPGLLELQQQQKLLGLLSDVDLLVLNKQEAAMIVPGVILTELLGHLANYCQSVIVTDGEMGAIATNGTQTYRLSVYEQVRAKDINGAGNAFATGYLSKLATGASFEDALQFAAANAASVVQAYGAETGLLTGNEKLHPMPIQAINDFTEEMKGVSC